MVVACCDSRVDPAIITDCDPGELFVMRIAEQTAIRISLSNLLSFPWVHQLVDAGTLRLHVWYFDMDQGEWLRYEPEQNRYTLLR